MELIIGIGTDLVQIERMQKILSRFGNRFRHRVFSNEERKKERPGKSNARSFAKRWAAKEAYSKALGTGFGMGVKCRDITISNLKSGQPIITVTGFAKSYLLNITPKKHKPIIFLSLSDEYPLVQAFVVIEAIPIK